jgi:hypothetical protein
MTERWAVDASGRFLRRDGEPWYPIGDTAWEAVRRLTEEEAEHYLTVRAEQGFNTLLTVAVMDLDGVEASDVAGRPPFHDRDPGRPNEPYWQHVDWFVRRANELGLAIGLFPAWGGMWADGLVAGRPFFDPAAARAYAAWLATRYRAADVFWVLGGDRNPTTDAHREVITAFAQGLNDVLGDNGLISYHPIGHSSSSDSFPDSWWLDFDLVQSGHTGWGIPNYQLIEQDWRREPVRPVLDGEPCYENHPVMTPPRRIGGLWERTEGWRFGDDDTRRAAHHAVFAGAAGHIYGCHDVWQCYDPERRPAINGACLPWRDAIRLPGAVQMGHLATLLREIDLHTWTPDQSVFTSGVGFLGGQQRALVRTADRPGVAVYAPDGREVRLDLGRCGGGTFGARWWDPREGGWLPADDVEGDRAVIGHPFPHQDGVLLLERRGPVTS